MKQITNKTILKQGDKTYQPIEVDGVIYWIDPEARGMMGWNYNLGLKRLDNLPQHYPVCTTEWNCCKKIVAQSQPKLDGIPVVNLRKHIGDDFYTQADIEKAIWLAKEQSGWSWNTMEDSYTMEEILEQINSISVIEVDEQFNVISYE